ncbi:hypothetical protein SAMN04488041_11162 [Sulfitobacter pontiacus]|uniref:Membrane protein involved in the export of O-antigen and teichoic acid n=2 Tax=Sulfitobacter pontiacus TaxID=60137 RepID=A0A1H3DN67_9RHOB|nr:hypothetical protein SAMN04488041_11162 [Sulfitobacter pontiacus]
MLYVAALQIGPAVASMDVYAETTRLFLASPGQRQNILSRHFSFLALAGAIAGPIVGLAFYTYEGQFSIEVYYIFPALFLTELFANDIARLLPPLRHPFAASIFLFVRQILPLSIVFTLDEIIESEVTLLGAILATYGATIPLVSIVLIVLRLRAYFLTLLKINLPWVLATIHASIIFFSATVAFRILFGIDRFIIASETGLATSGIYGLYVSFGLGIVSVLEAGVSAWKYPPFVQTILQRDSHLAIVQFKNFMITNLLSSALLCISAYFAISYIVKSFLETSYQAGLPYLHWVVLGAIAISASLPLHYLLFALRKDLYLLYIYSFSILAVGTYSFLFLNGGGIGEAFGMFVIASFAISIGRIIFSIGPLKSIYRGRWP